MDPVRSPYAPGSGRKPAALVGRDSVLSKWDIALRRADERGRTDQPFVIYGLRGVGKTVLLTQLRHDAEKRSWIVAQIEAGSGDNLRELIGEALYEPLHDFTKPNAGKRVLAALKTMLTFKASYDMTGTWNFGLDVSNSSGGGADSGILQTDLRKVISLDFSWVASRPCSSCTSSRHTPILTSGHDATTVCRHSLAGIPPQRFPLLERIRTPPLYPGSGLGRLRNRAIPATTAPAQRAVFFICTIVFRAVLAIVAGTEYACIRNRFGSHRRIS